MLNYHKKRLMSATVMSALALGAFLYNPQVTQADEGLVNRIQGNDRYETATLISIQTYASSDTVIIANAMEFADALAGVPLAYEKEAPILLAYGSKLRATTQAEIKRLDAKEAVILGGEAAISQSIEKELTTLGLSVNRISGDDRFETSALIADELEKTSPSNKAVVVDGMNFADAMSIAPFAAQEGMPIYLTKTHGLSNAEELDDYNDTYIVGGETAVSSTVEQTLNSVTRLAGLDRYETNREVLEYFGVEANELFVSTGLNFADALTGSVLAAQNNSAVALVKGDVHSKLLAQFEYNTFNSFTILGGEAAVPNRVKDSLNNYMESKTEVTEKIVIENKVNFKTVNQENNQIPKGETYVDQEGIDGYDEVTYEVTYADGTEINRNEINRQTVAPVNKVIVIGTQVIEVLTEKARENQINYEVIEQQDDSMQKGKEVIVTEGHFGYDEVTYEVTYTNGFESNRKEISRITIEPINKEVIVGTKDIITKKYGIISGYSSQQGYYSGIFETTFVNGVETSKRKVADIPKSYSSRRVLTTSQKVTVPYSTKFIEDSNLEEKQQVVLTAGIDGIEEVEFTNIYIDNNLVFRGENKREVILRPVEEVIAIGTKATENDF